ncbi:hypothetical protein [Salipiger sp.]|uniref:DsrE family protein n=1 Tax=Salipiger sp. TaxID=2078585 RepID=UPI003A96EDA1
MIRMIPLAACLAALPLLAMAEGQTHRVAIHVDQNDPQVMTMALNNAENVAAHYREQGDEVVIELVAYGPGLQMLIVGQSPVEDRIETMSMVLPMTFAACGNTIKGLERKTGAPVALLEEAHVVPSGVVRLIELQEAGYAYVKP